MAEKLYEAHSIQYSADRNNLNTPLGTASFSFWCDTPNPSGIYQNVRVGEVLDPAVWLPKSIQPHNSIEHGLDFKAPPKLHITDVHIDDEVIGELNGTPYRQYKITAEGYLIEDGYDDNEPNITDYSVNAEENDTGDISFTASVTSVNGGEAPAILANIGEAIDFPGVSVPLVCNSYKFSNGLDEFKRHVWTVIYECSASVPAESSSTTLPQEEQLDTTYELNGSTLRSIAGELIVLRRSQTPITKKTVIAHSLTSEPVYLIGSECYGGIALSDKVSKETKEIIQMNEIDGTSSITTLTYFRHEIEVEV